MAILRWLTSGAHQMEPPSLLISWVYPFPSRFINRTISFCNALESHKCACCLLSFLYFHWLFPLSARETSPGNRSIYKSTRERVNSKGLYGRYRPHLMGSCWHPKTKKNPNIWKSKYTKLNAFHGWKRPRKRIWRLLNAQQRVTNVNKPLAKRFNPLKIVIIYVFIYLSHCICLEWPMNDTFPFKKFLLETSIQSQKRITLPEKKIPLNNMVDQMIHLLCHLSSITSFALHKATPWRWVSETCSWSPVPWKKKKSVWHHSWGIDPALVQG